MDGCRYSPKDGKGENLVREVWRTESSDSAFQETVHTAYDPDAMSTAIAIVWQEQDRCTGIIEVAAEPRRPPPWPIPPLKDRSESTDEIHAVTLLAVCQQLNREGPPLDHLAGLFIYGAESHLCCQEEPRPLQFQIDEGSCFTSEEFANFCSSGKAYEKSDFAEKHLTGIDDPAMDGFVSCQGLRDAAGIAWHEERVIGRLSRLSADGGRTPLPDFPVGDVVPQVRMGRTQATSVWAWKRCAMRSLRQRTGERGPMSSHQSALRTQVDPLSSSCCVRDRGRSASSQLCCQPLWLVRGHL